MKKALLQLAAIGSLFFLVWFLLLQVNWEKKFNIQNKTNSTEQKVGDMYWDLISKSEKEVKLNAIVFPLDTLIKELCVSNEIDEASLKIHILHKDQINAFALPNRHLVVFTGLIKNCESEAELLGVLGHEIAHIEKNHIMKKLVKEVGLSVLVSATGSKSGEVLQETLKLFTSSSYDRNLEREADITSADYLVKANIDAEPFANFLYRLSDEEKNIPKQAYWISTHPESKERAEDIVNYIKNKKSLKQIILKKSGWNKLKETVAELDGN